MTDGALGADHWARGGPRGRANLPAPLSCQAGAHFPICVPYVVMALAMLVRVFHTGRVTEASSQPLMFGLIAVCVSLALIL